MDSARVPTLLGEAAFTDLRRLLHEWGFDEEGLATPPGPDDPKGLLSRLFLQRLPVDRGQAIGLLGDGLELLEQSGLAEPAEGEQVRAAFLLYPLRGLHIASDFPGKDAPEDFVFPAISQQTWEFLGILPETPCHRLLEVGTGSGAAALTAARYADEVYAGDVSSRCLAFAEFNRRLNGIKNCEVRSSDVYDAFAGLTFDRIVAHPPYVPWTGRQETYRHAGADGEQVLRRLIEGLAERLEPGGRFYASAMGLDTADAGLEQRVREMLGPRHNEFDVLLIERETLSPLEFILPWTEGEDLTFEQAWSLSEAFRERRARALVRCSLVVSRSAEDEPRTQRRKAGRGTDAVAIERTLADRPEPFSLSWDELLDRRFELAPLVTLETFSEPEGDQWAPRRALLDAQSPFAFRTDCPAWAAELLPRLDGATLREALGDLDPDPEEAAIFLGCLLDAGVLEIEE